MVHVFAEGDETCEGGDQGTDAADIHADEQVGIVGGKLRQQDRGGYVAYELA